MGRAPCCDKEKVKRGPWSPQEDATLKAYIEEHGTGGNWIALPQKIGLKRCGKSCRLRWLNYLRPNIKHGGFSEEEDRLICSLYITIGSRWSIIAAQLPGRTDNDIKNYWNTRLKKKLLGKRREKPPAPPLQDGGGGRVAADPLDRKYEANGSNLTASAIERLRIHMQLQNLHDHPLLSYNHNPLLWPNLNPIADNGSFRNPYPIQQDSQVQLPINKEENISVLHSTEMKHGFDNSSELENVDFDQKSTSHGYPELNELMNGEDDQILDYFGEIQGSNDGINWWRDTNNHRNFDDQYQSSSSSSSVLQPDLMLEEYVSGYGF